MEIVLKGQTYRGKLDFKAFGLVQAELKKQGFKLGIQDILEGIANQDFLIITELTIQSILRCHPQLNKRTLEDKLDLSEMENVFTYMVKLVEESLPQDKVGK